MSHADLIETAKEAIENVFSDQSVGPEQTLDSLEELTEYIVERVYTLSTDE